MGSNCIYINKTAVSPELCADIINLYYIDKGKYDGMTMGGVDKTVKNTTDLLLPSRHSSHSKELNYTQDDYSKWEKIENCIQNELNRNVVKYIAEMNAKVIVEGEHTKQPYNILSTEQLTTGDIMIQRYEKNIGRYIYHHDESINWSKRKHRVITYLFYLNTVEDGGETEFWGGELRIKPEVGKLLLFPASWTYPHRGMMPLSSNKYIMTGWLYAHHI